MLVWVNIVYYQIVLNVVVVAESLVRMNLLNVAKHVVLNVILQMIVQNIHNVLQKLEIMRQVEHVKDAHVPIHVVQIVKLQQSLNMIIAY
jgi:hypothetical protein